jgi:hypothetical protein
MLWDVGVRLATDLVEPARGIIDYTCVETRLAHEKKASSAEDGRAENLHEKVRARKSSSFDPIVTFSVAGEAYAQLIVVWGAVGGR